jgi:hypothetical protein
MEPVILSGDEWALIRSLRDVPRGLERDRRVDAVCALIAFIDDPRCAESQGDGVPCASVGVACEECPRASGRLLKDAAGS